MSLRIASGINIPNDQGFEYKQIMDIENAQAQIDLFASKWIKQTYGYCNNNNQKLAVWYLWTLSLLSLRSLRHLAVVNDVAGCYTIARSCLEHDISVLAIIEDASLGDKYMNYGANAKNRYLMAQKDVLSDSEFNDLQQYLTSLYGPEFPKMNRSSWHGGFRKLCEIAKRKEDYAMYVACCQFTHGTITGAEMLNVISPLDKQLIHKTASQLLSIHTCRYIKTTEQILNLIFGKLWTQKKQDCFIDYDSLCENIFIDP